MEFLAGSIVTLFTIFWVSKTIRKYGSQPKLSVKVNQSRFYEMVKHTLPPDMYKIKKKDSQLTIHSANIGTKIMFVGNDAYWIGNGHLMIAESINGKVNMESAKRVDTINMDKVQLEKMIFIVDKLTEGLQNDRGNTGNTQL